ncbi:unnamed protein product [Rhizoctonia solani]|uniref:Carboxylic ester hydrolase n=1 Tax=Rhizoctonia solani TaxID=456999 RepID=A0A8H3E6H6_9AGAM|nr:unnamed protein product [Rhizoctonia solani]
MVYIYGGAFYIGDTLKYPGTFLVEKASKIGRPIIYVSMNYRVGIYGFPPGQEAYDSGGRNLGFKDQRLALEWISKNIKYFGGDPNKVTIFGTSAGAISAGIQTLYDNGKPSKLFRGMILESGSPETIRAFRPNDPAREAGFQFIVNATGCSNDPSPFECARNAPAQVLSRANKGLYLVDPYYAANLQAPTLFGPTYAPEDDFITRPIHELLHSGQFAKIPFINGGQLDEGTIFVDGPATDIDSEGDIINWLTARFPGLYFGISNVTAATELLKLYPASPEGGSPYGTGNETFGKGEFGVKSWSHILKESSLDYAPAYGIAHAGDVPFVFQTLNVNHPDASVSAIELMETIAYYWINFAYSLDPNAGATKGSPYWPQYGKGETALQLLGSNVTTFKDIDRVKATDFIIGGNGLF